MIKSWKVANFKSIQNETELELAPLTIFAGANSSGKSTFIQSILLLAQTLSNKVSSRSVILNGALTSLGQFDDLKSNDGSQNQISIGCVCKPLQDTDNDKSIPLSSINRGSLYYDSGANELNSIKLNLSFDAESSGLKSELLQLQPRLYAAKLICESRDEDNLDFVSELALRQSDNGIAKITSEDIQNVLSDKLRSSLSYDIKIDEGSLAEIREDFKTAEPVGCIVRHFLPVQIVYTIDRLREDANSLTSALRDERQQSLALRRRKGRTTVLTDKILNILREILSDHINSDTIFTGQSEQMSLWENEQQSITFAKWIDILRTLPREIRLKTQSILRGCDDLEDLIYNAMVSDSTEPEISFVQARPPRQISKASRYIDNFFATAVKYLGPLRDAPKPLYPLAPAADPHDVGIRGEHTASILDLHKDKKIKYISSASFENPVIDRKLIVRSLESAVIDWLQYLGVANKVMSKDKGKLGHELKVALGNSDREHDLTHVGVGVSQILPILVMCLLADTDTTLVFEQPELHLHPKVQTLLGDFFMSMALSKKQCIVETHSEYLVDRLRFRIAAATEGNELNDQTKIYFVEKPENQSEFREVLVNEYGAISDWPAEFFDQSQNQAELILRAALDKKRKLRLKIKQAGEKLT